MSDIFNIKKKGGLIVAFFFINLFSIQAYCVTLPDTFNSKLVEQLIQSAKVAKLDQAPLWSALLHAENGHSNIEDSTFLLSLPKFSLSKELAQTINFLFAGASDNVCRFPARYLWLNQQLNTPELPLDSCPNVIEFRQKSPIDSISLVFASEKISQPASMLGHAFLKLSGKNVRGQEISHAISFYTDANTYNLPKLLFDSLVIGKRGYFSLSPYPDIQQRYVDEEQRNLWEYQLILNRFQRELIRLHILELKQSHLTYFFQKYNCATVINFILALSGKSTQGDGWWVTPKELIKNADHEGLIGGSIVITPSRWMFNVLSEQVPLKDMQLIIRKVNDGNVSTGLDISGSEQAYTKLELARAYNQLAYISGDLDKRRWIENDLALTDLKDRYFPSLELKTNKKYDPRSTPGENQLSITAQNSYGLRSLAFTVLPISHTLSDDNRSYAGESNLQLFETTLLLTDSGKQPILDKLVFFDMESLMPYEEFSGGSSIHFRIALEPQLNSQLNVSHILETSGSYGFTKRFAQDMDVYSMAGGGLGVGSTGGNGFIYTNLETGVVVREIWNMKSWFSVTRMNSQIDTGSHYNKIALKQSKFIDSTDTFIINWERNSNNSNQTKVISFTLKKIF